MSFITIYLIVAIGYIAGFAHGRIHERLSQGITEPPKLRSAKAHAAQSNPGDE